MADVIPEGIPLGIVRGITYGLFGKPDTFMPPLRELGATLVRVYVYWSQVEPDPGNFTFEVIDPLLDQLMASLPPQLQMFMRGCPPVLEAKRARINCREIVMRNVLALSAGVRRTVCWNLAPEIPGYENALSIMDLLFGKFALLDYERTELRRRHPSAEAFALMTEQLAGVEAVTSVEVPEQPDLYLFDVRRGGRGPLLVVWQQRDSFSGEGEPPVPFEWPSQGSTRRRLMRWVRGSQSSWARAECACTCHRPRYS
jgi:hypothetical protein